MALMGTRSCKRIKGKLCLCRTRKGMKFARCPGTYKSLKSGKKVRRKRRGRK